MHWTTDEKDARQTKAERRYWKCPNGHESSAIGELKRCPVAFCRSAQITEDRTGKRAK